MLLPASCPKLYQLEVKNDERMVGIMISLEEVEANRKRSRLGKKEKLKLSTPSSTLVTTTTATTVAVSSDTRDSDSIVQQIPSKENWEWTNLIDSNSINVPILFSTDSKSVVSHYPSTPCVPAR